MLRVWTHLFCRNFQCHLSYHQQFVWYPGYHGYKFYAALAGAELGQAQLKLGTGFTLIYTCSINLIYKIFHWPVWLPPTTTNHWAVVAKTNNPTNLTILYQPQLLSPNQRHPLSNHLLSTNYVWSILCLPGMAWQGGRCGWYHSILLRYSLTTLLNKPTRMKLGQNSPVQQI